MNDFDTSNTTHQKNANAIAIPTIVEGVVIHSMIASTSFAVVSVPPSMISTSDHVVRFYLFGSFTEKFCVLSSNKENADRAFMIEKRRRSDLDCMK